VEAVEYFLLPLPAPYKVSRFRVCFRFQLFSSKCFRFHKRLTAFASTSLVLNEDQTYHAISLLVKHTWENHLQVTNSKPHDKIYLFCQVIFTCFACDIASGLVVSISTLVLYVRLQSATSFRIINWCVSNFCNYSNE